MQILEHIKVYMKRKQHFLFPHFIRLPMLELTTIKRKRNCRTSLKERRKAGERRKFKILFTYFLTMLKNSYMMMITLIMRSRDVNNDYTTFLYTQTPIQKHTE